jgi:hypothetical protein
LPQNVQTANDHIHLPRLYSLRQLAANCALPARAPKPRLSRASRGKGRAGRVVGGKIGGKKGGSGGSGGAKVSSVAAASI